MTPVLMEVQSGPPGKPAFSTGLVYRACRGKKPRAIYLPHLARVLGASVREVEEWIEASGRAHAARGRRAAS